MPPLDGPPLAATVRIRAGFAAGLRPPPSLTVSQWADRHRILPAKGAAEPGRWNTDRTPHLREILDCMSDDHPCQEVVAMLASQTGKTEVLLNVLGKTIHVSPCPILIVQPTDKLAERFSKQRVAPMIEATPELRALVADPKSRESGNTIQLKEFPGGVLVIVGANSPADLASMPIRIVLLDEIDRFAASAGTEGSPIDLAVKRTTSFGDRKKIGVFSTPTIGRDAEAEGDPDDERGDAVSSQIWKRWLTSDRRIRLVPCPHCGTEQELVWERLYWTAGHPETAHYVCLEGCVVEEHSKATMLPAGRWQATAESRTPGFRLSALYLPLGWDSWAALAAEYEDALTSGDPDKLQTFVNTRLCRLFDPGSDYSPQTGYEDRTEEFAAPCPAGVLILTAGVDVQHDRLEVEVVGWGIGEESWSVDYQVIPGDPGGRAVWDVLDAYLAREWEHETHAPLRVQAVGVDCGDGNHSQSVYDFTDPRAHRRIWAVKGRGGPSVPIWPKRFSLAGGRHRFFTVGVHAAKDRVVPRFRQTVVGPGYTHVPHGREARWFAMMAAEQRVSFIRAGVQRSAWFARKRRNEALDVRVYAYAVLHSLGRPDVVLQHALDHRPTRGHHPPQSPRPRPRGGYMDRFRNGGRG